MTAPCRVGFAEDFLLRDGSLAFPDYDLGPLRSDPAIEVVRIPLGPCHSPSDLESLDVLVSVPSMTAVDASSLAGLSRLVGIVRVGVGCDDLDVAACTAAGVVVVVPSEAVRRPTAVAALTLILALTTRLLDKDRLTREGSAGWARRTELRGRNLEGRVLGLVGCGSIGSDLVALVRPLGLRVVAFDPALTDAEARAIGVERAELGAVLAGADIVSIHCPLSAATRHLIDAEAIGRMKPGALIVNTARGGIIEQRALVKALESGHLGGAGLDVFDPEPLPWGDPLLTAPNVVLSAHALNWTKELDHDLARQNVAAILDLLEGRTPRRIINPEVLELPLFRRRQSGLAGRFAAARAAARPSIDVEKGPTA